MGLLEDFGWLDMVGTYEERKVANYRTNDFVLDTCLVTDRDWIYETAIAHKDFNNGDWIILDGFWSKEDAEMMHKEWIKTFTTDCPEELTDFYTLKTYRRKN